MNRRTLPGQAVQANLDWFLNSGIMRPDDGFWGVGERIVLCPGNDFMAELQQTEPQCTELGDGFAVIECRRADCAAQAALLFHLAADYFGNDSYRTIAGNLIDFLFHRSGMLVQEKDSEKFGLWRWGMQHYTSVYTDDNAWLGLIFLWWSRHGRPELEAPGLAIAAALHLHMERYVTALETNGHEFRYEETLQGTRLNPHWLGMCLLPFAWAWRATRDEKYRDLARRICLAMEPGPPQWNHWCHSDLPDLKWAVSEYAYWAFEAAVAAAVFEDEFFASYARGSADALVRHQGPEGNFHSNHYEAPKGAHLADLVYTQNWANLGLLHVIRAGLGDTARYQAALERSDALLVEIQDREGMHTRGCWRGMYDCRARQWGGGDKLEGGERSIYSGWTNAPISIGMLLELTDLSLTQ